jgi:hypothetical protein
LVVRDGYGAGLPAGFALCEPAVRNGERAMRVAVVVAVSALMRRPAARRSSMVNGFVSILGIESIRERTPA